MPESSEILMLETEFPSQHSSAKLVDKETNSRSIKRSVNER